MKIIIMIAGALLLLNSGTQADTLFRWVDAEGKVHYGDRPAEDAVGVTQKKFASPTVTDEDLLPYESRRARQIYPVTLYVADNCGDGCAHAREFLNKRGIPFTQITLSTKEEVDEFKKLTGSNGVPLVAIGKIYLQGFESGRWNSELDIAGYPKSAPYGARPVVTTPKKAAPAESEVAPATAAE